MVLKKNKTANSTLFIDASKECVKVTNNKLTEDNISKIAAAFTERTDAEYFCRLVPDPEITEHLSISRA